MEHDYAPGGCSGYKLLSKMETRSEAKSTHRGSRSDLFLLSFVRPPSRMKLLPSSESMDARFSLPLHNLTLGPKLMPDPVAGGHALYMNLISGCRLPVAIPTNVLSSVQAASRAVFSPWPVFQREFILFAGSVYLVSIGNEALGLNVPVWAAVSCPILALPCILLAHAQYRYWKDGKKAASLGARLAPTVPMRLPGGIDLLAAWMEGFRTGYVGGHTYPRSVPRENDFFFR